MTDKDYCIVSGTWNSAQCYMAAWMGGEFGRKWVHVYVWLGPSAVYLKLTTLFVNQLYPNAKLKIKKERSIHLMIFELIITLSEIYE